MEKDTSKGQTSGDAQSFVPQRPRHDLVGKWYVNLLRCSNLTQADTSPEGQKQVNDMYSALCGMSFVQDVYGEGVSGSQTFNREDIQEILDLHRQTPFDVVVVHDLSRLTRGGIKHGNRVEDLLEDAGIEVVSSTDMIPEGPDGNLIKSVKHYSNQMQARSISLSVARGLHQSLIKNSRPAAGRNPYALDRLYVGPDGRSRMLVRWDGMVQLWLKPETLEKVGERIRPARQPKVKRDQKVRERRKRRSQQFKGYTKQTDETSRLVPGSEDRMRTLIWMFTAYFVRHWGYHRIAHDLNERKIPGPEGGRWSLKTIRSILFNPIYLGVEVRYRYTGALYNKITANGTVPVIVNQKKLEKDKRTAVPHVERPRVEWQLVDVPRLKNIIPSQLREIATERVMKEYDADKPPHPKKGKAIHTGEARHKHLDSPFLLSWLLHSKQTTHWMRGEVVYKKLLSGRKMYRYYFDGGAAVHGERGLHIRRVPAEPVEQAVLGVIEQVLADSCSIEKLVRTSTVELSKECPDDDPKWETLLREKEDINLRLRQAYRMLGKSGAEALAAEMATAEKRLDEINRLLKAKERMESPKEVDVEEAVRNITGNLHYLRQHLHELPNAEMKHVLAALVDGLKIDLATDELELDIVLPDWMRAPMALGIAPNAAPEGDSWPTVRFDSKPPWLLPAEANGSNGVGMSISLSRWTCYMHSKNCYSCSRKRRAA